MKLAFSTVGCPEYHWSDVYTMAKDTGFDGIELRVTGGKFVTHNMQPFSGSELHNTIKTLNDLRLSVPCLSSGCALNVGDEGENIKELEGYIRLAKELGTEYIRVLGDSIVEKGHTVDDERVKRQIRALLPLAEECGVVLLVETNGVYGDTKRLGALLTDLASDNVAALWDVHHPYRFFGESPETTLTNLGTFIKYVHIKDSVETESGITYKLMGEGDLPIESMMLALRSINYEGYVSLEWISYWAHDMLEPGVVFPQFVHYMGQFMEVKSLGRGDLYTPHTGVGQYVWPHEQLIDLTFPQLLDKMVEEFPNQIAFDYSELDYTRTYSQFRDDVDAFARALIAMNVKRGDHVAIWATNVPAWYITFWATTKIGAVLVTVNTAYKIHEIEYLLRQSDTHTLVMTDAYKDSNYVDIIYELCPELKGHDIHTPLHTKRLPFLRNVVTCESKHDGCVSWEEARQMGEAVSQQEVLYRAMFVDKHDVCNMQYTSGTTGFPKGVMLTHYNVVNNGKAIGDCMDLSTADRMMIQVPMFHCFGMVLAMTASVTHGSTMSPITAFSPRKGLKCINEKGITAFHGVPTMFIAMLSHPDFPNTDFSHMRTGIMAGSPCPIKVMEEVVEKMHMSEICITYGQTEASPATTMSKITDSLETRVNTVGAAIYGVECKIVDPETGADLPDNTDGEFVARGYNIMKGYYKMPTATAAAIDKDGWLHSGDIARRDENGYYKITGRIKDMIIRGGENIYPKEIEEFIYTHPKVSDVQVIGVPSKDYGEEIMACIILKEGESMTEDEVKEYVLSHMAKHKVPRYVDFVDSFPMNAAGKILKYKMREAAVEKLKLQAANAIETA